MYRLDFFGTRVNFIDFSVIYVSQGSVVTYVRWYIYIALHSKFHTESVSERIFKID